MLLGSFPYLFTIDNGNKVGNHAYVFENWKQMPILFTFENVTCVTTTNLTQVLLCVLLTSNNMDVQVVG